MNNRSLLLFLLLLAATSLFVAACSQQTEAPCEPEQAFELGRSDQTPPPHCHERAYSEAWQLGQTLGEMERERDALAARADDLDAADRMRLRVLQRDIPELETLARIQGLMEQAQPEMPE
ncbi:MAG: hypothetical protein EA370_01055 [Wenzhouxiangella sp.]|nr:MAG: hypothetical protein EA370_01055 [Wenzhouxiangella sp.]